MHWVVFYFFIFVYIVYGSKAYRTF